MMARSAGICLFKKLTLSGLFFASFLTVSVPQKADASFSSMAASFFASKTEAAFDDESPIRTMSSQNVAILLAVAGGDQLLQSGSGTELNIINGSALVADSGPLGTIADVLESGSDSISVYVVRGGDTLLQIAKMFDISVNTIVWANDLRGPKDIKVGQELVILPVSGINYTVKRGDTLSGIAKRHGGDLDEILKFNGLERSHKLVIGEEIIVPNGEFRATAPTRSSSGASGILKTYIDESVDSLSYYIRPILRGRKTQGLHGKNGIDIAPECRCVGKESIMAAAAGQVIVARDGGWNGGFGNYVVISHSNGTQTLYGHMYSVTARSGEQVERGQIIGTVGSSGNSTGSHVHFEIRGAKNPF